MSNKAAKQEAITYPVVELFDSISGEVNGFNGIGQPSTFIRLNGCNLQCRWCDTLYAQGTNFREMTIKEITHEQELLKHITITGGEPLLYDLQPLLEDLYEPTKELNEVFHQVTIETNGTRTIHDNVQKIPFVAVMDYKLPSSGMQDKMNPHAFASLREQDWVKFVCEDLFDFQHALQVLATWTIGANHAAFSPVMGGLNIEWSTQLCDLMMEYLTNSMEERQLHYSLQIHKILEVR